MRWWTCVRPVRKMIMLEHLVSQDGWHIVLKTCNSDCYTLTMRSSLFGGGGILSNSNLKTDFRFWLNRFTPSWKWKLLWRTWRFRLELPQTQIIKKTCVDNLYFRFELDSSPDPKNWTSELLMENLVLSLWNRRRCIRWHTYWKNCEKVLACNNCVWQHILFEFFFCNYTKLPIMAMLAS